MLGKGGREKGSLGENSWAPNLVMESRDIEESGDECGGFIIVDEQTKTMGELQWARILVRLREECRPSVLEIEVEEEVYAVSLWWECCPVLRRNRRHEAGRHSSEVRGEEASRAEQRVTKEWVSVRLETLNPSDEGTDEQGVGSGRVEARPDLSQTTRTWASIGKLHSLSPIAGQRRQGGPIVKQRPNFSKGCSQQPDPDGKLREGPNSSAAQDQNNLQETGFLLKCLASRNPPESEPFVARESEDTRKLQGVVRLTETDRALEEESMRYGTGSCSWGKRALGASHLNSILFDRTPGRGGEFYDHSGDLDEEVRADNTMWLTVYKACNERINGCKELGVIKSSSDKGREMEGAVTHMMLKLREVSRRANGKRVAWRSSASSWASPRRGWRRKY
ncbi:hypothetical protein CK203_071719 [Vitis vinifera]|uniref:DUF4283 domain-containing protein n=1 Tax=Vitis vinifera TaxID=29760 RepID=A0A438C489_VITVI|nr:hypothetical protein CK203_071719 [Vitis vinifera]